KSFSHLLGFVRFGVGLLNFVMLEREKIEPFDLSRVFGCELGKLGFGSLDVRENVPEAVSEIGGLRESVDQGELVGVIEEGLLFVLSMDVQNQRRQFAQSRNRRRLVVDVHPVPCVGRDLALDDDLVSFGVQPKTAEFSSGVGFEN